MPAIIAAGGSIVLGAFGAGQEAKRQKRLMALAEQQKKEAQLRGRQTISRYREQMASPERMRRLALGTTGAMARLRTTALEQSARQQRTQDLAIRKSLTAAGAQAHTQITGGGAFGNYLRSEGQIGAEKQQATSAYESLMNTIASTEANMSMQSNAEQTKLGAQMLAMKSEFPDAWGTFASGMSASLGAMAGPPTTTTTAPDGTQTATTGDIEQSGWGKLATGVGDWFKGMFGTDEEFGNIHYQQTRIGPPGSQ
tara:strand:+ start:378 stop:1139 length:762 start_codon:yes stop_codon:yes gene_type:complete